MQGMMNAFLLFRNTPGRIAGERKLLMIEGPLVILFMIAILGRAAN
jgi:hypothetical protein